MNAVTLKPLTESDGHLLPLWNQAAEFDPMPADLWEEKVWKDAGVPDGGRMLAVRDGEPAGLLVAASRHSGQELRGYVKLLAVSPKFRRQGIGSQLLAHAERSLAELGCQEIRIAESAPNYLTPGVDQRYQAALPFFTSHGYSRIGESVNMTVSLDGNAELEGREPAQPSGGRRLKRATPQDRSAVLELLHEEWPAWEHEVLGALQNSPPTLFLVWEDSRVIGFSAFECNNRGTGWFGPMGVAPAARGLGLGHLLLQRCLQEMKRLGFSRAIIPWVGPTEFYAQSVGAVIDRRFFRYQKYLSH